jgi:hypothetical protein
MKKNITISLLFIFLVFQHLSGQYPVSDPSLRLENLFDKLAVTTLDSARIIINDSIDNFIKLYAASDSVFTHRFTRIRYLGQVGSSEEHLKIITWNLILRNSPGRYYCYFINRTGKVNSVYKISGIYEKDPVRTDTIYTNADWYGALYYDVRMVKRDNEIYWVLLGVDYGNPAVTRKIIDVVNFEPDGKIIFGKKLFSKNEALSDRVVLEYSSDAVVTLKFITDSKIAFDHLVPFSPEFENNREKYGPEFSYDGYLLEKGLWKYRDNIDIRNKKQ